MFEKIKTLYRNYRNLKSYNFSLPLGSSIYSWGTQGKTEQLKAYQNSAYVYACVKKRSEKVSELINFKLFSQDGKREIIDNQFIKLLYKPNEHQNKNEFWELYQVYKDLTGCAYIWEVGVGEDGTGIPKELILLRSDRVKPKFNKDGSELIGYEWNKKNGKTVVLSKNEVIASYYPHPLAEYMALDGLSALRPGYKSVSTENQLSDYQFNVLKNGGKIEGIMNFKNKEFLSEDQIKKIRKEFEENYVDARKSGKPMILYGDMEYSNLGLTPTELSYLESKRLTREDILTIYQVPKTVLGITDGVQKGNYEEANRAFIKDTINPLIKNIIQKLNQFYIPEQYLLTYQDRTPVDVEQNLKVVDNGTKNFYMTTNEKRRVMGMPEVEDGDQILVPLNLIPVETEREEQNVKKKI